LGFQQVKEREMGAETFTHWGKGGTAEAAFEAAVKSAQHDYGHSGLTGSIAEKDCFVMIECPVGRDPDEYADFLIQERDERIDDKWGPAGCIKIAEGEWLFFGWASS
jgi:hypothetical protein